MNKIEIKKDLNLTLGDIMDACQTMMNNALNEVHNGNDFSNNYELKVCYPGGRLISIEINTLNPIPNLKVVDNG